MEKKKSGSDGKGGKKKEKVSRMMERYLGDFYTVPCIIVVRLGRCTAGLEEGAGSADIKSLNRMMDLVTCTGI